MSVLSAVDFDQHEEVAFFYDKETGLKAIIAIHNTNRGPALGGCRMWPYLDEQQALTDALRLSRAMTYKAAMANLPLGGGKLVIMGDSRRDKSPELFKAVGRCIDQLNGRYIGSDDLGTSVEDMISVRETTTHVVGFPGRGGDPSPFAALGVYESLRTAVDYRLGKSSLKAIKIAVQGLGHVGYHLCKLLADAGAALIVTDLDPVLVEKVVKEFKAKSVNPKDIYGVEADVFSPCALGAILNEETIQQLKIKVIVGSANNELERHHHGNILDKMKILYSPDYVVNAGGLIDVFYEGPSCNVEVVRAHIEGTRETLLDVFKRAKEMNIPTHEAADMIAESRFKKNHQSK